MDKKEKIKKDKNILLFISGNKSIGYKRNIAVKHSKTKYVCFIDSDAYPNTPWLNSVDSTFSKYKNVGAVGGPNLSPKTNDLEKAFKIKVREAKWYCIMTAK